MTKASGVYYRVPPQFKRASANVNKIETFVCLFSLTVFSQMSIQVFCYSLDYYRLLNVWSGLFVSLSYFRAAFTLLQRLRSRCFETAYPYDQEPLSG